MDQPLLLGSIITSEVIIDPARNHHYKIPVKTTLKVTIKSVLAIAAKD